MAKLAKKVLDPSILDDLKNKQALMEAACRCLENERSYRFFCHLSALSQLDEMEQERIFNSLDATGDFEAFELEAVRRLVSSDAARSFKDLVDLVRDIRVEQEIDAMLY
jgi:hypothetical protein